MESFRQNISDKLRANRERISDSSIKTYSSMLCSINKKIGGEKELEFFSKEKERTCVELRNLSLSWFFYGDSSDFEEHFLEKEGLLFGIGEKRGKIMSTTYCQKS